MTTVSATAPQVQRSRGRALLWLGLFVCLLGPALIVAQFSLKRLSMPWYSPALATLGACLLLASLVRRRTVVRFLALVLVVGVAAFQWYALAVLMKLPAYAGPVVEGTHLPSFHSEVVDEQGARPFTDADLRDGSRRVMVFFRGRW
jgi:hypothetical protein